MRDGVPAGTTARWRTGNGVPDTSTSPLTLVLTALAAGAVGWAYQAAPVDSQLAAGSESGPAEDFTFAAGMTIVIQPNVITRDEQAGVQTGELVLVTGTGWESLHRFPRGFTRL